MSKAEDAYEKAAAEFVKAKQAKTRGPAYEKAKDKMRKARAAWREARLAEDMAGVVVEAETIAAKAAITNL